MWATWPTLPKKQQKNNKCWKMMIFDHFANFVIFELFHQKWPHCENLLLVKKLPNFKFFLIFWKFIYKRLFLWVCRIFLICFRSYILILLKFHAKIWDFFFHRKLFKTPFGGEIVGNRQSFLCFFRVLI